MAVHGGASGVRLMFVGLVGDPSFGPSGDDSPPPPLHELPHLPWQPFAWFAVFCWMLYLVDVVDGFLGYLILLAALLMGCWRLDRWLSKVYWGGLTEL
jgi:hypothetical protein